jgi:hypothetical protein
MDIKKLCKIQDSEYPDKVEDASYEDIGRNYARKWYKEKGSDEGFEESFARWRYRNKEESVNGARDEMTKLVKRGNLGKGQKDKKVDKNSEEEIKKELYNLTKQFVYKYQPRLYKQYKGEIDDLVSDFYTEFLTAKSRESGKEESLLDKYDPEKSNLPYLTKVAVQRMLIDKSRSDKDEKNLNEKYDEETGELSLDYVASTPAESDDVQVEDIEFDEDQVFELRDKWDELPAANKKALKKYFTEVKSVLSPNFRKLFEDIIEGKPAADSCFFYSEEYLDKVLDSFNISDAEKVELKNKSYSMYELQNKPPKWVTDLELWDHILEKLTNNGEKELTNIVPALAIYKKKLAKKQKAEEYKVEDSFDLKAELNKAIDFGQDISWRLPLYSPKREVHFYIDQDSTGWDIEMSGDISGGDAFVASGEGNIAESDEETRKYIYTTVKQILDQPWGEA